MLLDERRLVSTRAVKEYFRQPRVSPRSRFFVHDNDKLANNPVRGVCQRTVHLQIHAASKFLEIYLLPNPLVLSSPLRDV